MFFFCFAAQLPFFVCFVFTRQEERERISMWPLIFGGSVPECVLESDYGF